MPFLDETLFSDITIQPSLFMFEKDGKNAYLFGTQHHIPITVLPEAYMKTIRSAGRLVLESIREEPPSEELFIKLGFVSSSNGSAWYSFLSPSAIEVLQNALKHFFMHCKMKPLPLERITPELSHWICDIAAQHGGLDYELDKIFEAKAQKTLALETKAETTPVLPRAAMAELEAILLEDYSFFLTEPKYTPRALNFMKQYLNGTLLFNINEVFHAEKQIDSMVNRNLKWLPKIKRYFQEHDSAVGPLLFAVGAAHLLGRTGLLYLLEQQGFSISHYNLQANQFSKMNATLVYHEFGQQIDLDNQVYETFKLLGIPANESSIITKDVVDYLEFGKELLFSDIYQEQAIKEPIPEPPEKEPGVQKTF